MTSCPMFITEQAFYVFRALGVTLWELFEGAKQPYPHLSDREVLHHVLKDQQVRLLKPQLDLPYSERWLVLHSCFCFYKRDQFRC